VGEKIRIENIVIGDIIDGHIVSDVMLWPITGNVTLKLDGGNLIVHGKRGIILSRVKRIKEKVRGVE